MTKTELISQVKEKSGLSQKEATKAVEAVLDSVTQTLSKGESVQLIGFGSFAVRQRQARKGRNPRTGAELNIAAHRVPVFSAGKALKEAVAK
jgi:DNA-binding protein HU-beta